MKHNRILFLCGYYQWVYSKTLYPIVKYFWDCFLYYIHSISLLNNKIELSFKSTRWMLVVLNFKTTFDCLIYKFDFTLHYIIKLFVFFCKNISKLLIKHDLLNINTIKNRKLNILLKLKRN